MCTETATVVLGVMLLFATSVVLPIHFGHWLCPGAAQMVLPEGGGTGPAGNSADVFLLLVHGFCVPMLAVPHTSDGDGAMAG